MRDFCERFRKRFASKSMQINLQTEPYSGTKIYDLNFDENICLNALSSNACHNRLVPEFRSCTKDLWTGPITLFPHTEPVGNCDAISVVREGKRGDSRSGNNGGNEKSYAEYSAFRRLFAFQKLLATATRTGNKLHRTKPVSAFAKRNKRA